MARPVPPPAPANTKTKKEDDDSGLGLLFFVGVGLLLSVVGFVALLARDLDMFKPLPPPGVDPPGFACRVLGREFVGVEDLVTVSSSSPRVLLGGADDRLRLWHHANFGPRKTPRGALVAVYDDDGDGDGDDIKVENVPLTGFPPKVAFHPHGLYYHKESQKLYVVNHAYAQGGERIDVFKVSLGKKDGKVSVAWKYAIAPLLFQAEAMGTLNDLVVLDAGKGDGEEELFVTSYLPFPDPVEGRLAPNSMLGTAHQKLIDLAILVRGRWTRILYCKGGHCRPTEVTEGIGVGINGIGYNGINLSPDKRRLLVADTKYLHVFDILAPQDNDDANDWGGSTKGMRHRLRRVQLLTAPHLVDNIEPVIASSEGEGEEAFTLGSVGHISQFLQHNQIYAQQLTGDRDPSKLNITGGIQLLTRNKGTGLYGVQEVFLGDGSGLSGVSAAVQISPSLQAQDRYLLGSWSDRGVLLCTKQAASEEGGGGGGKDGEL